MSGWPSGPTHRYVLPLDSIGTFRDGESGCDKCVTNVCQTFCHTFVTHWSHRISSILRRGIFENKIVRSKSILCSHNVLFGFGSGCFEIEYHCKMCDKQFGTVWHTFGTPNLVHSEVWKIKNNIVSPKWVTMPAQHAIWYWFGLLSRSKSLKSWPGSLEQNDLTL